MKKTILRASAGFQALALMGAGITAGFVATAPAAAQDYTSGAITGTVTDESGAPVAGASVTLRSLAVGQTRTFTTNASGSFTASGLAPGQYELAVNANGFSPSADTITVAAATSSTVTVSLVAPVAGDDADTIVVRGRARQVQTQGTTGQNINVVKVNEELPIGHDVTSITLLAPTTSRGVAGFTTKDGETVPSVGGGSVAENAYYINGLNVTNPDTYVGGAKVPFYFYQNVDVQTGGYPAEFGKATGGVINATSKSGTNIPFVGLHLDWEPDFFYGKSKNTGNPDFPGEIGRLHERDRKTATLEAGGAIVQDHLFVYGMLQANRIRDRGAYPTSGVVEEIRDRDPFWGVKVDGYITPTQHAEFTIFDTRTDRHIYDYHFEPNDDFTDGVTSSSADEATQKSGGLNWVARYTGSITDWLTASAAYGISKDNGSRLPNDTTSYYVIDRRTATTGGNAVLVGNPFGTLQNLETKRRFYRGDVDIRATFMGQHQFRAGFDQEDLSEVKTTLIVGDQPILYDYRDNGVRLTYERLGGAISAANTSFYAQDTWTGLVDGLTLNLGIRNDHFKQYNLTGEQYLDLKGNWGPRLGFSYIPPSMDNLKVFGSFGRYFIPPAMNLGYRGRDLYYREYFEYPDGYTAANFPIDPQTGLPMVDLGDPLYGLESSGYGSDCPFPDAITGAPGHPTNNGDPVCLILGADVQDPALAKMALDAKATYENEFILGTRYRLAGSRLELGLTGTMRKLGRVSEDTDFAPQLYDHYNCDAPAPEDVDRCDFYTNNSAYYIWNPGSETLNVNDWYDARNGIVTPITLEGLTFSKPKRTYRALVFDFARSDDGLWFANGSVTWSKSIGSNEGTVKSDAGNVAQADAGSTQDFDYTGLDDNNYGLLPNHRKWTFKLYGAVHPTKALTIGANVFVQSPFRGSCFGIHPTNPSAAGYGASSFFCPNGQLSQYGSKTNYIQLDPAPRGTGVKGEWMKQLDLSARYNIPLGDTDRRKLTLRADVFNVFNGKAVLQRYATAVTGTCTGTRADPNGTRCGGVAETYVFGATGPAISGKPGYIPDPLFGKPQAYQPPRFVRLGLDLLWGGAPALAPVEEVAPPPPPPAPAPATQTCADGTVILATDACPVPPPPAPPAPAPERG